MKRICTIVLLGTVFAGCGTHRGRFNVKIPVECFQGAELYGCEQGLDGMVHCRDIRAKIVCYAPLNSTLAKQAKR